MRQSHHCMQCLLVLALIWAPFALVPPALATENAKLVTRSGKLIRITKTQMVLDVPGKSGRQKITFAINEKTELESAKPGQIVTVIYARRKPMDMVVRLSVEHDSKSDPAQAPDTSIETLGVASSEPPADEKIVSGREPPSVEPGLLSDQVRVGTSPETQAETNVTGCIVEEDGKYLLEDADGHFYRVDNYEQFSLSAGEQVIVHGTIGNSGAGLTLPSDTRTYSTAVEINAAKIDRISDTCNLLKRSTKSVKEQNRALDKLPPN